MLKKNIFTNTLVYLGSSSTLYGLYAYYVQRV